MTRFEMLKQSEIFAFLAMIFLVGFISVGKMAKRELPQENQRKENPPIIILSEREDAYRFELGRANVPIPFRNALQQKIIPLLDELAQRFGCDTIEVVGHTDGVYVRGSHSNLDARLIEAFHAGKVENLKPGSNVDLGMMRALAILEILKESQQAGRLKQIKYFLPYSAGQLIKLDRTLAERETNRENRARRRIEIRLLKSTTRKIDKY